MRPWLARITKAINVPPVRWSCRPGWWKTKSTTPTPKNTGNTQQILMKKHALAVFRQPPERLNCAQAVLHAWREVSGDTTLALSDLKALGGGRAPAGICGALHAACLVAPGRTEALKAAFGDRLGSIYCGSRGIDYSRHYYEAVGIAANAALCSLSHGFGSTAGSCAPQSSTRAKPVSCNRLNCSNHGRTPAPNMRDCSIGIDCASWRR